MIPAFFERRTELEGLGRRFGVRRLEVFGSAATEAFHAEDSDLDFLVEFEATASAGYTDRYLSLLESLQQLFADQWTWSSPPWSITTLTSGSPWSEARRCSIRLEAKKYLYDIQQAGDPCLTHSSVARSSPTTGRTRCCAPPRSASST